MCILMEKNSTTSLNIIIECAWIFSELEFIKLHKSYINPKK